MERVAIPAPLFQIEPEPVIPPVIESVVPLAGVRKRSWLFSVTAPLNVVLAVLEIVAASKTKSAKPFGSSHVNQMLVALATAGLVYKNRHGKYSFAVPLFGQFVLRQMP